MAEPLGTVVRDIACPDCGAHHHFIAPVYGDESGIAAFAAVTMACCLAAEARGFWFQP
jgi:hypothetical protein